MKFDPTNRRVFLKQLVLSSILPTSFSGRSLAFGLMPPVPPVEPMTVLAVSKTALDVIGMFCGSKDSAIAAMLRYQSEMLPIITTQLTQVQSALVDVQNNIAALPRAIREEMRLQFREELIAEVRGAARRYTDSILPAMGNRAVSKNENVQREIADIINTADQKLSTLKTLPGGIGPESCMIASLAMGLEVACRAQIGYPKEIIRSSILKYDEWFKEMLSDKQGSILDIQSLAMKDHDAILDQLKEDFLAQKYSLENYKLTGTQTSAAVSDPLVIFSGSDLEGRDRKSGIKWHDFYTGLVTGIYDRVGSIETYADPQIGANLIKFGEPTVVMMNTPREIAYLKPNAGVYCYVQRIPYNTTPSREEMTRLATTGSRPWSEDDVSRARMEEAMAKANLMRATISFCSVAASIAGNSRNRIKEYLQLS